VDEGNERQSGRCLGHVTVLGLNDEVNEHYATDRLTVSVSVSVPCRGARRWLAWLVAFVRDLWSA